MDTSEFEQLVADAEAEHERVTCALSEDFGAIIVRPATALEAAQFAITMAKIGEWEAEEELAKACAVAPSGAELKELIDEAPATISHMAAAALDLAAFTRAALAEEIAPFRDKARRIAGWVDDELGEVVVMRSPKRLELKRLRQEIKSADQRMAAAQAVALSCCVSHSQAELEAIIAKRPAFPAQVAPVLMDLANAAGNALGKARR